MEAVYLRCVGFLPTSLRFFHFFTAIIRFASFGLKW